MSRFELIRVGVDFSAHSAAAVEEAVAIARRTGAAIELVHANESFHDIALLGRRHPEEVISMLEATEQAARRDLERLRLQCEEREIEARAVIARSRAAEALASDPGALVVIGTAGGGGLGRFLKGATTTRVVRAARGPVLVAHHGLIRYQRLLVATDFSEPAARALDAALELAAERAAITAVHAWQMPALFTEYSPPQQYADLTRHLVESAEAAAAELAAPLLKMLAARGFTARFQTVCGDPAAVIVERAAGHDLIALGSRGRQGIRRLLAGSVAERVVTNAPCSVLVVH